MVDLVAVVVEEEEVLVAEEEEVLMAEEEEALVVVVGEGEWVSLHLDNMVQDESKPERNITLL